jgi:hypothetical protein
MFELVLGIALAAVFVAVYLLIAKFLRQDKRELGSKPQTITLNPVDTSRAIGARRQDRALTAGELSEHHAGGKKSSETAPEDSEK